MARKPRIQYEGALYHVINRGNYRQDLFSLNRAGEAFERTLYEACERYNWKLYAYVIMSNHYHLCLKTEEANLQQGMQWLQSVFANRFNRYRNSVGHVFQGRYKALLIGGDSGFVEVVNYIHLNPVRAGIVSLSQLGSYRLSSFSKFLRRKSRAKILFNQEWLDLVGGLKDTASGMRAYQKYLRLIDESDPGLRKRWYNDLCRGWFIGTKPEKKSLLKAIKEDDAMQYNTIAVSREDEADWLFEKGLCLLKKTREDVTIDLKGANWKVALAYLIKSRSGVKNGWLSEKLNMGDLSNMSKKITTYKLTALKRCPYRKKLIPIYQA